MENDWFINGKKLNPDNVINMLKMHAGIVRGQKTLKVAVSYGRYHDMKAAQKDKVSQFWEALKEEDRKLPASVTKESVSILQKVYEDEKIKELKDSSVVFVLYTLFQNEIFALILRPILIFSNANNTLLRMNGAD